MAMAAAATLGRVSLYRERSCAAAGLGSRGRRVAAAFSAPLRAVALLQLGKSGSIARALTRRYDFEAFFNQSWGQRCPCLCVEFQSWRQLGSSLLQAPAKIFPGTRP